MKCSVRSRAELAEIGRARFVPKSTRSGVGFVARMSFIARQRSPIINNETSATATALRSLIGSFILRDSEESPGRGSGDGSL